MLGQGLLGDFGLPHALILMRRDKLPVLHTFKVARGIGYFDEG